MYIQTNDNNEIIQFIKVGNKPEINGYEIDNDTDIDILRNIFSYKFIDGEFILKDGAQQEKLKRVQEAKINALNNICHEQIVSGFDHTDGHHYSLQETDQLNLQALSLMASQGQPTSWKYDNGVCQFYTPEEMLALTGYATKYIMYHSTYYNQLKDQIKKMTSIDDIIAINYGVELDSEHAEALSAHTGGFVPNNISIITDTTDYTTVMYDVNMDSYPYEYMDPDLLEQTQSVDTEGRAILNGEA